MTQPTGPTFHSQHFQDILDLLQDPACEFDQDAWPREAAPQTAQDAFLFTLAKALKSGPHASPLAHRHPNLLLSWSHQAVLQGWVPPETTALLRDHLHRAATELRKGFFWDRTTPLWWEPVMAPSSFSRRWLTMHAWSRRLNQNLADWQGRHSAFLLHAPGLLPKQFVSQLFGQLERHYQKGTLKLVRAGVGKSASISDQRHDEVRYLDGCEAELMALCPDLCLLVRWAATQITPILAHASGQRFLAPPQRAMLARYPANSGGYEAHVDNPGGQRDNGRGLTVIFYLNPAEFQPAGGSLHLWESVEAQAGGEIHAIPPLGGSLVSFDSREWLHQVAPLGDGQPRWALSLWLNDRNPPTYALRQRRASHTDMLFGIQTPAIPATHCAMLHFDTKTSNGDWRSYWRRQGRSRVGIVCTTYRAHALLPSWCQHHFQLGFAHLILVFDHLDDPSEAALAKTLVDRWGTQVLTVLDGQVLRKDGWPNVPNFPDREAVVAATMGGSSSWAVAARQSLNASYVLQLAKTKRFGGQPLDWLLHLDSDEFFHLQGPARGGESLETHFAIASQQKWPKVRYLNDELLPPWQPGTLPYFKENPRIAAARLGDSGWGSLCDQLRMNQTDGRAYFAAYHNGKSAVRVSKGFAAAGVHDWHVEAGNTTPVCLAGPAILHFHCPDAKRFAQKFQAKTIQVTEPESPLFEISPLEKAARQLLQGLAPSVPADARNSQLAQLFERRTAFSSAERELLNLAKLLHPAEALGNRISTLGDWEL